MKQIRDAVQASLPMETIMKAARKFALETALDLENGNVCRAARRLHVHRNTTSRDCKLLGVKVSEFRKRKEPNSYYKHNRAILEVTA
jgi:transcriptional regulator of acetoin/glycerol metabolism